MNKEELMYVLNTSIDCDPINESMKMTQFIFDPETQRYTISIDLLETGETSLKKPIKIKKEEV